MRLWNIAIISLVCVLAFGCRESVSENPERERIDPKLIDALNNIQMENAVIAQHTLFPYHFVRNGAELNELGQRDFDVLAKHFAEHAGVLNIRRGNAPVELYEPRVSRVIEKLKDAGVDIGRVGISDGMPGGPGMASERVVTILQKRPETTSATTGTSRITGMR
ncbi:MAG: hypothetical protein JSU70_09385 [Phycisphaerales bacterium]|nr:MAG: hypothetical protein JSU70_09385 [Phycisphaerales bacterium]